MNRPLAFVSWNAVLTEHQSHTLACVPRGPDEIIRAFAARAVGREREAQGWTRNRESRLPETILPAKGWGREVRRIIASQRQSIHLFSSPFSDARVFFAFVMALNGGLSTYLITEPYSTTPAAYFGAERPVVGRLKQRLRPMLYNYIYGPLIRRVRGVLAISPLAVRQFAAAGVPGRAIFPFGYFVPPPASSPSVGARDGGVPRAIFLGALIRRKGLADLALAAQRLRDQGQAVAFDVYGPGDPLKAGVAAASDLRFRGVAPFGQVSGLIGRYDVLVLPSLFDGWGVVVNEALQAGVPVVCSDAVGASGMVRRSGAGAVFPSGNWHALAEVLAGLLHSKERLAIARAAARAFAPRLTPEVGGSYMRQVIGHVEQGEPLPTCPWYDLESL